MSGKIKISVLIVTYNNIKTIEACLESVNAQACAACQVLVRDNASVDESGQYLQSRDDITFFAGERNIGFGAAVNYLAGKAGGDYLFLLNPDCICPAGLFDHLLEFAGTHDGVISPALEYQDGSLQRSARELPSYRNIIFSRRSPLYLLRMTGTARAGYLAPSEPGRVPAVSATAILIKRDIFKAVGGFDERFFMYGEDLDLCKRLSEASVDIWYLPQLRVKHLLGASSEKSTLLTAHYHHLSIFKYFTKHFPEAYIKNLILAVLLSLGLVVTMLLNAAGLKRRK